jgi:hypothetical protein
MDTFPGTDERIQQVVDGVTAFPGVSAAPHRYGGTEFRLGSREVGHVHRWGAVDVAFTRRLRDAFVEEGWTGPHHVYPDSGWTTFRVVTDGDVARALALLELSYCYHRLTLGDRLRHLPPFAVRDALDRLAPSAGVRAIFAALEGDDESSLDPRDAAPNHGPPRPGDGLA